MEEIPTAPELLEWIQSQYKSNQMLSYKHEGVWHGLSTEKCIETIQHLALGIKAHGIQKGDKVAVYSNSSPWWILTDLALLSLGIVTVPIFANISEEHFLFQIEQTEPKLIFTAGEEPWKLIGKHSELLKKGIQLDPHEAEEGTLSIKDFINKGKASGEKLESEVNPQDVATIIYTSGSTGVPKGAVITQEAVLGVAHVNVFHNRPGVDRFLNILPLAHIFARNVIYNFLAWGVDIYFVDDVKNTGTICKEIHPTGAIVVPRLMEKVFSKMVAKVQAAPFLKRIIGLAAIKVAQKPDSFSKKLLVPLFDKLVYSKFREAMGGKVRGFLSGGAPLNCRLLHFFNTVGVPLFSGYGLTEGGCTACNSLEGNKYGTVGRTVGPCEHKVLPDGELVVRGKTVMREYYKAPERTKKAIDADGWLHTGDKATIDDDGYITIIGRFKELYKTSTGKYIAPAPIEQELTKSALVDMAMVVAEDRKFATCLLFPDMDVIELLMKKKKKTDQSVEDFLRGSYVRKKMNELIQRVNKKRNPWEAIGSYRFVLEPISVETGELTPTMKMKREVIAEKYSGLIESMYEETV